VLDRQLVNPIRQLVILSSIVHDPLVNLIYGSKSAKEFEDANPQQFV
jgi:hypothetical protein